MVLWGLKVQFGSNLLTFGGRGFNGLNDQSAG
jgi:hypothetical protein